MVTVQPGRGRDLEMQEIGDLLGNVRERGGALVVQGEPGIGKSYLLAAAAERAKSSGFRVLQTTGVESEAALPFAGLHQLLAPVLDSVESLPLPQRLALLTAFGMADSAVHDRYLVALAALELLAESAVTAPLLVLAEDAHWLDRPTCEVLAFVARRIESESIALVAALRPAPHHPLLETGVRELTLSGLDDQASAELLEEGAPRLPDALRRRVLAESFGNPLALLELPTALADAPSAVDLLTAPLPLTARLERTFAVRLSDLPDRTRAVLLAAAVDDRDDLSEVLRVASATLSADVDVTALEPAVRAGLVGFDESGTAVVFRHPLVRSAIHRAAAKAEIRHGHAQLASLLTDQPDRRAWHRAAAAPGPDEEVALDLEQAAGRAQARGGAAAALAAQQRAAQLTPDRARRGGRLLDAAETAYELGDHDLAEALRREAESQPLDQNARSRAAWLRGAFDDGQPGDIAGLRELLDLAEGSRRDGHSGVALQLLFAAARRCWWSDPGPEIRADVVDAANRVDADPDDPRMLAIIAIAASLERGADVVERLARWTRARNSDPALAGVLGMAAFVVGDFERATEVISEIIAVLREQGRLGLLAQFLLQHSFGSFCLGEFEASSQSAHEATGLAAETGQPVWAALAQLNVATIAALRGEAEAAESRLGPVARTAFAEGNASMLNGVLLARGISALAAEEYDIAYEHLSRMFDPADPAYHRVQCFWQAGYLAEAAVHSGNHDQARALFARIGPAAEATGSPGIGLAMRYARAVLADDGSAESEFRAALASDSSRFPYHRARLQLAYGSWLRRQRRILDSREPLRAAMSAFDQLGVEPWAARARRELAVAGEAAETPAASGWDLLSPQERQIAGLVAEGLSNREIAQRLYLSHRTVGSHLYRIFPKLDITSRMQLITLLTGPLKGRTTGGA